MVADKPAPEPDQDWPVGGEQWPLHHAPDGRGCRVATDVRRHPVLDRPVAGTTRAGMWVRESKYGRGRGEKHPSIRAKRACQRFGHHQPLASIASCSRQTRFAAAQAGQKGDPDLKTADNLANVVVILAPRLLVVVLCLMGAACASSDIESRELVETAESSIRAGTECRSSVSGRPEYRSLAQHMPLVDVNEATLTQMTDTSLAIRNDFYVIADWHRDIRACRVRLLEVIEREDPLYVPIVLTGWNNDDEVLVLLAQSKIAWGDAVMRLRANRAETLTKVADQLARSMAQRTQEREAALSRRVSFINALVKAIPLKLALARPCLLSMTGIRQRAGAWQGGAFRCITRTVGSTP